jgi:hypothetical protein
VASHRRLVRRLQVRDSMSLHLCSSAHYGDCEGILVWHIREGHYGGVSLDGLNVVALGYFEGNIWEGEAKATMGMYMDERPAGSEFNIAEATRSRINAFGIEYEGKSAISSSEFSWAA